ncbi:MAG: PEGA domain-containing protein [Candidatus Nealsonbacteria bacterium]|nr:PEGA domain-containing protein [Candidatus Nealsonbacteria bacterium]
MTQKSRFILFISCILLFALASPLAIFYSQGYRFDFANKKFTQTGGIFLKVFPRQADVYLDGKLAKKTDFFFGSALIENLLPKSYQVRVEKEGYFTWEKNLEVKEKEVTEEKFITLIPEKNNFETLSQNVDDFWVSPDGKKIILRESETQGWSVKLYDLEKNLKSRLLDEKTVSLRSASLFDISFKEDSREIFLDIGAREQEKSFSLRLDKASPVLTERKIPVPPIEAVVLEKIDDNNIYYLDNFGFVYKTDASFGGGTRQNAIPFPVKPETEYRLDIFDNFLFLRESGDSYLLRNGEFEKIIENVTNLKISPDKKKLAITANSEIWIFFLQDVFEQPRRSAGEKLFLLRLSQRIPDIFWLNDGHLIFSAGSDIKIAEIDNRDRINVYQLAQFPDPRFFWNESSEKIYVLSQKSLQASERLLR